MKKAVKNLISSVLPQAINIISNLILPGLIIAQFGSDVNGLISTTKTVVSYISLVGAGIATAVTQSLYQPVARNDINSVKGMLRSANDMFNRYGCIYIIITIFVSFLYPIFIKSEIPYWTVSSLLLVMSISGASEFFAIGRCRALLYAHQKVYICSLVQAISLIMSLLLAILMLKLNANIVVVQFSISLVYVLRGFFLSAYVHKKYNQYSDFKSVAPLPSAINKRGDAMVHQLAGLAVTGSQSAILTLFVGLNAASIYSVYNIVLYGIRTICSNLFTAITPFLGKEYALGNKEYLSKMYNVVEFAFFYFVTFVLSVTAAMILPFVSLYTRGADIDYVYPVFSFLFVLSSAFYILKLPGTALINVAGHFKETKWRALIEASLSVFLSIVFTVLLGKSGVLIGTGIALCWRCFDTIFYVSKNILEKSAKTTILRLLLFFFNVTVFKFISDITHVFPCSFVKWCGIAFIFSFASIILLILEALIFERKSLIQLVGYMKKKI